MSNCFFSYIFNIQKNSVNNLFTRDFQEDISICAELKFAAKTYEEHINNKLVYIFFFLNYSKYGKNHSFHRCCRTSMKNP